ncbi:hypothetical protein H2248_000057 [Termitomyces sp. 'cryptogamus']|nr:hypothetical protein H2248_000057 [Termitomyces sp. 'cryptogamus']
MSNSAANPSGPSRKKHKRSRSSGELSVSELGSLASALENIAREIKIVQAHGDWEDLEELHHLADTTDAVIKQIKRFQNLKNKDENVVIVSLSDVDKKILSERLGMQETVVIRADSSLDVFSKKFTAAAAEDHFRSLDRIERLITSWDPTFLFQTLSTVQHSINRKSEAASRIAIDPWLLQGMRLIQELDHASTVLYPELLIWSRNSGTDDPPVVKHNNEVTYLAGSADYGLLSILPFHQKAASKDRVSKVLLEGENAVRGLHFFSDDDVLNVCEAKRVSKSLKAHEPQVIAECLAIIAKCNASRANDQRSLNHLAFTLTSGEVWIFGVVDAEKRECFRTAELKLNMTDPKAVKHSTLRALMMLIMIWNTQPADIIKEAMTAYSNKN